MSNKVRYKLLFTTFKNKPVFAKEFEHFITDLIEESLNAYDETHISETLSEDKVELQIYLNTDVNLVDVIKDIKQYTTSLMWDIFDEHLKRYYPIKGTLWDPYVKIHAV